jgi:hypothetical protein
VRIVHDLLLPRLVLLGGGLARKSL